MNTIMEMTIVYVLHKQSKVTAISCLLRMLKQVNGVSTEKITFVKKGEQATETTLNVERMTGWMIAADRIYEPKYFHKSAFACRYE